MRGVTGVMVLLAACGRIDFSSSPAPQVDGAAPDGTPPSDGELASLLEGCELGLAMDEVSWTSGLVDRCGANNPGAATGGALPADDAERGRVGELVGGTSCIIVSDAPELRGGSALTLSAWIRPAALAPSSFGIVSKRVDFGISTAYSLFVWTSDSGSGTANHLYVDIDTENERFENPTDEFLGAWHQVTTVFDGARPSAERVAIYVDGALRSYAPESSSAIATPAAPPDVHVGCLPLSGPAQSLVGRIDDVTLWSRALSAAEVSGWYTATR